MTIIGYELYIDQSDNPELFASYNAAYDQAERYLEKGYQVEILHVDGKGKELFYEAL